jgi:hypothetical protein
VLSVLPIIIFVLTVVGGVPGAIFLYDRWTTKREKNGKALTSSAASKLSPAAARDSSSPSEPLPREVSTTLFGWRMARAFPGSVGLVVLDKPAEAIRRLAIVLAKPLVGEGPEGYPGAPFWWFSGGLSVPIPDFEVLALDRGLLGFLELPVRRIGAFRHLDARREFIYVELAPSHPTQLYAVPDLSGPKPVGEEYAVLDNHLLTLEELQDGYAIVDGEHQSTAGAERRLRYLTPFNLVICAKSSPINSSHFDQLSAKLFPQLLEGTASLEDLVNECMRLPIKHLSPGEIW